MDKTLQKTKKNIERLKKRNPAYKELLDFYSRIIEQMSSNNPSLNVKPAPVKKEVMKIQVAEGFPLLNKEDFILDLPSSSELFAAICIIAKDATTKMKKNIQKIDTAVKAGKLNREKLLEKHSDPAYLDKIAKKFKLDRNILNFLIHMSIKPSLIANADKMKEQVDLKNWLRGYCPVCGSLPLISELKGEGQRYWLCSFCGFNWPGERLKCPYCENTDHEKLHFLYAEGQEAYRVDLCDKCKQYIKTVDSRKLDYEPDLNLEDIVTIHLDIIASGKGYKKPVPSPW